MSGGEPSRWLLLVHQLPKDPAYLRAKIGRQLARVGAVAVKNSVYVLPANDETREDFQWILREAKGSGGDATVFEASVVDGLSDAELEERFKEAIAPELGAIREEAEKMLALAKKSGDLAPAEVAKLRKRLETAVGIDFFFAKGRAEAIGAVSALEARVSGGEARRALAAVDRSKLVGRTWATRKGVHVDRIATSWLIRRFIDRDARFVFFGKEDQPKGKGILFFDTFGGDFTHEGDLCSFEVLAARAELLDAGVEAIAEIIHDLDLKDNKYGRPETAGVIAALNGICWSHEKDLDRIAAATPLFDALYESFRRRARREEG
jgi:hypothetical protein